jgi:hypothetical protein
MVEATKMIEDRGNEQIALLMRICVNGGGNGIDLAQFVSFFELPCSVM